MLETKISAIHETDELHRGKESTKDDFPFQYPGNLLTKNRTVGNMRARRRFTGLVHSAKALHQERIEITQLGHSASTSYLGIRGQKDATNNVSIVDF